MYDINELEFVQIIPRQQGIFVSAKYPTWCYRYSFLIQPNGNVKGRTSEGNWLNLSQDFGSFVRTRAQYMLSKRGTRIY